MGYDVVPIFFTKGAWYALDDLCQLGYNVVSLDWLHNPVEAFRVANSRVTIQGNADSSCLYGMKEAITSLVEDMVKGFNGGKQGWIANMGHSMTWYTLRAVPKLAYNRSNPFRETGDAEILL